jgi:hypothetical protein
MPADAVFAGMNAALEAGSVDPAVVLIEAPKATKGGACPRRGHQLEFTGPRTTAPCVVAKLMTLDYYSGA